jgi:hypothetical protein
VGTYDDVVHVVLLDLRSEVDVDLDSVLRVLFLQRMQKRVEPFSSAEIAYHPGKVNLEGRQQRKRLNASAKTFESRVRPL